MKRLFLIFSLFLGILAFAGYVPSFGGEYTNLCGSGTEANFYNCQASCNINNGSCTITQSGQTIFVYTCSGRQIECRSNEVKITSGSAFVTSFASVGSGKTVQIDVFKKDCRAGGGWSCDFSDLLGYIVWYSGSSGGSTKPSCNYGGVSLSVNPETARTGNIIQFIVNGDASTWFRDEISGGVTSCNPTGVAAASGFSCTASNVGNFTWTRIWRHCVGSFDNCSDECRLSKNFTILSNPPIVVTLPAVETL